MRPGHSTTTQRAGNFTLVELLVVMVIVIMLMAATIPAVMKLSSSSGVEAGARMVGAQLRLARQEAITRRRFVAVVFPTTNTTGGDTVAYTAFRPCYVRSTGGSFVFDEWVPNVDWTFCPVGAVIAEVDLDGPSTGSPPDFADGTISQVDDSSPSNPDFGFSSSVRAVVFRPAGRLAAFGNRNVTLVEGAMPMGATTPTIKQPKNWINIQVNQFTGRVTYERPEDIL